MRALTNVTGNFTNYIDWDILNNQLILQSVNSSCALFMCFFYILLNGSYDKIREMFNIEELRQNIKEVIATYFKQLRINKLLLLLYHYY